jgi:hypothetical protein
MLRGNRFQNRPPGTSRADQEPIMAMRSFAVGALLLLGTACEAATAPGEGDNLALARARWEQKGGESYSYVVTRSCFCVLGGRTVSVTVKNGVVSAAEYSETGGPVEATFLTYVATVPDLFDLIQDALSRNPAYFSATYDPVFGYPTRIEVDYSSNAVDDEVALSARDLTLTGAAR